MAMQQDRDRPRVAEDAGDVRRGRERPDPERSIGVVEQLGLETRQVDPAVRVLRDRDDVGDRLAPRQLVAVVLVRPDEDDRPFRRRDPVEEVIAIVELGGQPEVQDVEEPVDRSGRARPAEDHRVGRSAADASPDELPGLFAEPRRLEPGPRRLGVGVRVERQDRVADVVLDEREGASRGGVVGVRDAAWTERPGDGLIVADDGVSDRGDERLGIRRPKAGRGVRFGHAGIVPAARRRGSIAAWDQDRPA